MSELMSLIILSSSALEILKYMLINKVQEAYTYNKQQQNNTILTQSYYDLVMKACDSIGTGFRTEFKNSTFPIDEKFVASRL